MPALPQVLQNPRVFSGRADVIDPDEPTTWPIEIRRWGCAVAEPLRGTSEFTSDLNSELIERDGEFRKLFAGRNVLAYHCTRLLDYEACAIREQGLQPLTRELVTGRIERAHRHGALAAAERTRLERQNVFALGDDAGREGQVCLILGRSAFDESAGGCEPLLSMWGGEAIYWAVADDPNAPQLGRPSIAVARIDVSAADQELWIFPSLAKLFVGILLGTEGQYADVFLRAPVPAEDIMDIWQPGHAEYDRHPDLPRM